MFFEIFSSFREKRSYLNQESQKIFFFDFRGIELKFSTVGPYYVYNKVFTVHRFSTFRSHMASGSFTSLDFQIQGIELKFGTFIPYYLYISVCLPFSR